jgi:hypothetical protein
MKNSLFLMLCLIGLIGCGGKNPEVEQVQTCFDAYKNAVIKQDGKFGATLVNSKTINYFGQMLEKTLHSPKSEVQNLRTSDKLLIVRARHQIAAEDLKKMTAADFFAYGIGNGWTDKDVGNLELRHIGVSSDMAKAELIVAGKKAPSAMGFVFRKEDGQWKLNLLPMLANADQIFKQAIHQQDVGEEEFILNIVESLSGTKVPDTIWNPVMRRE